MEVRLIITNDKGGMKTHLSWFSSWEFHCCVSIAMLSLAKVSNDDGGMFCWKAVTKELLRAAESYSG
jgi:hypothetical protein